MNEYLCKNLRLSIRTEEEGRKIRFLLRNDLTLTEVELWVEVGDNTLNRRYHQKEAMVIAARRLIDQAIAAGLILDYPGEPVSSKSGNTKPPNPSITFSIDEDLS